MALGSVVFVEEAMRVVAKVEARSEVSASEDRWRTWRRGSAGWVFIPGSVMRFTRVGFLEGSLGYGPSGVRSGGMVCPGAELEGG